MPEVYHRLHRFGPEYGGDEEGNHGLTNHGPMAVEVMVRRGLEIDVNRWLDRYVRRLAELPTTEDIIPARGVALGAGRRRPAAGLDGVLPARAAGAAVVDRAGRVVAAPAAGDRGRVDARGDPRRPRRPHPAGGRRRMPTGDRDPRRARPRAGLLGRALPRAGRRRGPRGPAHRSRGAARRSAAAGPERLHRAPPGPARAQPRVGDQPPCAASVRDGGGGAGRPRLARRRRGGGLPRAGHGSPVLLVHAATAPNAVRHVLPTLPPRPVGVSLTAAWAAAAAVVATYAPARPAPRRGRRPRRSMG